MLISYPVTLEPAEGGAYIVRFPDLPEAITFGKSREDAMTAAADCLREALRSRMADDEPMPAPSPALPGQVSVTPPAETAAKAAVYAAFIRSGLTKVALAGRMGISETEVRRILDPSRRTKLGRLEEVAASLGHRIAVAVL